MKIWRTAVEIKHEGFPTEQYFAPWVSIFKPHLCQTERWQKLVQYAKFLYILKYTPTEDVEFDVDNFEVETTYKELEFHPMEDIYNRLATLIGFHI